MTAAPTDGDAGGGAGGLKKAAPEDLAGDPTSGPSVLLLVGPASGGMGGHVAALSRGLAGPDAGPQQGGDKDRDRLVTTFTSPATAARFAFGGRTVPGWPDPPARGAGRPGESLRRAPGLLRRLRGLVRRHDVVHAHGHQAGLLAVLLARTVPARRRPQVVISWHNAILVSGPRRRLLELAERVQVRLADEITGASGDLVRRARDLGARKARLAEVASVTAVPISRAEETAADPLLASLLPTGSRGPVVLSVSRIAPQKRLDVLVEASVLVARDVPGVRWLVAGDGDPVLLATLERRVAALGAPVRFLGRRSDVPVLMAATDVLALSSDWEARALVVQEAMVAGLPVVATDVGGLPDLLASDRLGPSGLLVPAGDAEALATAVTLVLTDPVLAAELSGTAKQRFAELPGEDEVLAAWAQDYEVLVQAARRV